MTCGDGVTLLNLPLTPWVWAPLLIAFGLSVIAGAYGLAGSGNDRTIGDSFFAGPGLTNSGALSTILALIPLLLSGEVRRDVPSASLLGAATLLFALTTFLGQWLYASVAAAPRVKDGELIKITVPPVLIAVQNVIITCLIVGAGCFLVFVVITPLLGPLHEVAKSNNKVTILECTDDGCRRR